MSLLWAVGPVAMTIGVVLAVVWLRRTTAATEQLLESVRGFGALAGSVDDVRQAADEAVARVGRIRDR